MSTRTIALHDGESGINVLCGRREHSSGGGLTLKKGIEYHERIERVSTCTIAFYALLNGKSGTNVLWGRQERSGGGGPTPKRASRTMRAHRARLDLNDLLA